jgi:alkylation response protein AidB-like acyl-CoA dehydrogenase
MNFDDTPSEAIFRAEVRAWLAANAPMEALTAVGGGLTPPASHEPTFLATAKAWQTRKFDAGWACLQWPRAWGGRDATPIQGIIFQQEEGPYSVFSRAFRIGQGICGPTVAAWATEAQKQRYLPKIASGEEIWCQLFSEPAGGSDLAGLRTRAVSDGDGWIVNGQKIWTSFAHIAQFGLLLARTDPKAPKHHGLTMFFVDMNSPGIEVRPIRQANGERDFNEVFFTDLRIPDSQRLGAVGEGWRVSLTTLMNERMTLGSTPYTGFAELFQLCCKAPGPAGGLAIDDRAVRSRLADFATRASGLKYNGMRAISAISRGEPPGPENSIGKLVAASTLQEIAMMALDLQGRAGVVDDCSLSPEVVRLQAALMRSPATRIEGGTDEILKNIIAERVLGLPQDFRADKGIPFDQIPTRGR